MVQRLAKASAIRAGALDRPYIRSKYARSRGKASRSPGSFACERTTVAMSSVYAATKSATVTCSPAMNCRASTDIRVNVVSPGTVDTPGSRGWSGLDSAALGERARSIVPLGRTGTPEEIANAVLFLASDESRYMAGSEVFVDGGLAQV
jgi:NAD(P)-dependent dehydrogenase (short-subunit alcohol dehydrogenase family)